MLNLWWTGGSGTRCSWSTSGFPLSVSFHQSFIIVHLSLTLYNLNNLQLRYIYFFFNFMRLRYLFWTWPNFCNKILHIIYKYMYISWQLLELQETFFLSLATVKLNIRFQKDPTKCNRVKRSLKRQWCSLASGPDRLEFFTWGKRIIYGKTWAERKNNYLWENLSETTSLKTWT